MKLMRFPSGWYYSLMSSTDHIIQDNTLIMDYGCASCDLFYALEDRYRERNFAYVGVDKAGWGETHMKKFRKAMSDHPKVKFLGLLDDPEVDKIIPDVDIAVFGSVFTHLGQEQANFALNRFQPMFEKGGIMQASFFIEHPTRYLGHLCYGYEGCFEVVYYSVSDFNELMIKHELAYKSVGYHFSKNAYHHQIIQITKDQTK